MSVVSYFLQFEKCKVPKLSLLFLLGGIRVSLFGLPEKCSGHVNGGCQTYLGLDSKWHFKFIKLNPGDPQ